jgi:hypothetical protein
MGSAMNSTWPPYKPILNVDFSGIFAKFGFLIDFGKYDLYRAYIIHWNISGSDKSLLRINRG